MTFGPLFGSFFRALFLTLLNCHPGDCRPHSRGRQREQWPQHWQEGFADLRVALHPLQPRPYRRRGLRMRPGFLERVGPKGGNGLESEPCQVGAKGTNYSGWSIKSERARVEKIVQNALQNWQLIFTTKSLALCCNMNGFDLGDLNWVAITHPIQLSHKQCLQISDDEK